MLELEVVRDRLKLTSAAFPKVLATTIRVDSSITLTTSVGIAILKDFGEVSEAVETVMFVDFGTDTVARVGKGGDDSPFLVAGLE